MHLMHSLFSVRAVPRVDHIAHLVGISPLDWYTKPCERAAKAAGTDHIDLACRGLVFVPSDCAAWFLGREADRPINVFEASAGLLPMLTGRDPPLRRLLTGCNSLTLRTGWGLMWRLRPRSSSSTQQQRGVTCFRRCSHTSGDNILRCTAWELIRLGRMSAGK